MLVLVAPAIVGYAFVIPRVKRGPQIAVLTASLLVTRDLNSPYAGLLDAFGVGRVDAKRARTITAIRSPASPPRWEH
jgi:hypothetical protein